MKSPSTQTICHQRVLGPSTLGDGVSVDPKANRDKPTVTLVHPEPNVWAIKTVATNGGGNGNGQHHNGVEVDPEPISLRKVVDIPNFPVDALPKRIADMVTATSIATQTDLSMAGVSALNALSTATLGRVKVRARSGWVEPVQLFTVTIAASGERKSAVQAAMVKPIYDKERDLIRTTQHERDSKTTEKALAEKRAQHLANAYAKETDAPTRASYKIAAAQAREDADKIVVPAKPRIIADDITPEALISLLEKTGHAAVISPEGGIFEILAGRYSEKHNIEVFLKGHAGEPLIVDRVGRPGEHVGNPSLTVGLMIQPAVLSALSANKDFRGKGLLARFLYAFPVSKVGRRMIAAQPVPHEVEVAYQRRVRRLIGWAFRLEEDVVLTLSDEAQRLLVSIETELEPTLGTQGELDTLVDWGSKYVGAVLRIAGLLHVALNGVKDDMVDEISADTLARANRIGLYFKPCAINAFTEIGTDATVDDAVYLLNRIKNSGEKIVSARDMLRLAQRFKTLTDLAVPLSVLVNHHWLIAQEYPETTRRGRPPGERWRLNARSGT